MQLAAVFLLGICLGSLVNWAIYSLAWFPRPISPWSRVPPDAPPRSWSDRLPVIGWLGLRHEADLHGRGFWIRPLLVELGLGVALAALYWWEIARYGLVQGQVNTPVGPPLWPLYLQFASHVILLCWMMAASFIDIDEKIVPDEITVTGVLAGLVLATALPMSLLPHVAERQAQPAIGVALDSPAGGPAWGPNGGRFWLEPVSAAAPHDWPPDWARARRWPSLAVALGCYWLWCFALVPRIWRGRRGAWAAVRVILRRIGREFGRPPLRWLLLVGTAAIIPFWVIGDPCWAGLLTALIGLVGSGGIVWAVRLMGSFSLRREAMGFGDVTLMMMVGTFLGWQACLIAFFLAPFAGLLGGILQLIFRRDDVIPYVPYLCLASAAVVVAWAPIWVWAQPMFAYPLLVIAVLAVCLVLLGILLYLWRMIKTFLFGYEA
jgi:prepilin signal peptidase PulO-like enzyme (type II secretory pathway)